MSSDRVRVTEDVELGSYGAKWRHGWIPLNAAATALKAKRLKAGDKNHHAAEHHGGFTHIVAHSGSGTVHDSLIISPDGKGHHAQFPTRAAAIADGAEHVATLRGPHNAATARRNIGGKIVTVDTTGEAKPGDFTPGDKVDVSPAHHLHKAGMTGGTVTKTGRTKVEVQADVNGVKYSVPTHALSKRTGSTITAQGHDGKPAVIAQTKRIEAPKPKRINDEEAAQLFHPRTRGQLAKTHGDTNLVAHELSSSGKGEIRTEDGKIVSSNHVSKLAATRIVNAHNANVRYRKFETKVDKAPALEGPMTARERQIAMLPGNREVNGTKYIVKKPGANPLVPSDAHAVETWDGATVGHIRATDKGLHIGSAVNGNVTLPEHQVKNVKEALAGLHAAHTIRTREAAEAKAATDKRHADMIAEGKRTREEAQARAAAERKASDIAEGQRARARADSERKKMLDVAPPKATVTKSDSATKVKARDEAAARLSGSAVNLDEHKDVKSLKPGTQVTFNAGVFQKRPEPPHSHFNQLNMLTKQFELDGKAFTTSDSGAVNYPTAAMREDASGDMKNFTHVGGSVVYRHHAMRSGVDRVGTETVHGHIVHNESGTIHVASADGTYSGFHGTRGGRSTLHSEMVKRNAADDKTMIEDARKKHGALIGDRGRMLSGKAGPALPMTARERFEAKKHDKVKIKA